MNNSISAEIVIQLVETVAKTETHEEFERAYRFSMPVGVPFETAIAFSKEMTHQVEEMQKRAKEQEEANLAKANNITEITDPIEKEEAFLDTTVSDTK
jgi:hypothetical protein